MRTPANVLPAEDIIHVVPDASDPTTYHWLYVSGGFLVKLNVKSGEVVSSRQLPSVKEIAEKAGTEEPTYRVTTTQPDT